MKIHTFRLTPGKDLKIEIESFVKENNVQAAFIITCVGSLSRVCIRMAGATPSKQDVKNFEGQYEIVSIVGTVGPSSSHIHLSVSDKNGAVTGGHLKEKSIVSTTAEIVIGEDTAAVYKRILDETTGFFELNVQKTKKTK